MTNNAIVDPKLRVFQPYYFEYSVQMNSPFSDVLPPVEDMHRIKHLRIVTGSKVYKFKVVLACLVLRNTQLESLSLIFVDREMAIRQSVFDGICFQIRHHLVSFRMTQLSLRPKSNPVVMEQMLDSFERSDIRRLVFKIPQDDRDPLDTKGNVDWISQVVDACPLLQMLDAQLGFVNAEELDALSVSMSNCTDLKKVQLSFDWNDNALCLPASMPKVEVLSLGCDDERLSHDERTDMLRFWTECLKLPKLQCFSTSVGKVPIQGDDYVYPNETWNAFCDVFASSIHTLSLRQMFLDIDPDEVDDPQWNQLEQKLHRHPSMVQFNICLENQLVETQEFADHLNDCVFPKNLSDRVRVMSTMLLIKKKFPKGTLPICTLPIELFRRLADFLSGDETSAHYPERYPLSSIYALPKVEHRDRSQFPDEDFGPDYSDSDSDDEESAED